MLTAFVALALLAAPQDPPRQDPPPQDPPVTRVDDIIVDGRPLRVVAEEFVAEVGEAPRGRGLARWHKSMCVAVVNVPHEAAQPLIDHISTVALDLGVEPGDPGCQPNVVVIFTTDARAMAAAMVEADPRSFRLGSRTFNLDRSQLEAFVETDAPVRWWHTAVPTDSLTGKRAVRLPGEVDAQGRPSAPSIFTTTSSRINTQIRDDLNRILIVVDVTQTDRVSPVQLADYLAFVALAQIDPDGDTSRQPSVLNIFDDPGSSSGFSDWDRAYLEALYRPGGLMRTNPRAVSTGVATGIARSLGRSQPEEQ
jgi:hypothetical protein